MNNNIENIIKDLFNNKIIKASTVYQEELKNIENRYKDKSFKIAVVGEFSSGKSTFINALLGKDLLNHATLETTATVTYIHNSDLDNKVVVNYKNNKRLEYKDYSCIKDNTTTQSENDVVNTVDSVEVYTKFHNLKDEFIIVDTPGLNGVADKHREKTIDEIKRAHACIYVLQKNGFTDSDRTILKFLFNYQQNFIFIQNFIDELKASEGETLEKKINSVESDLKNIIDEPNMIINYEIVGVSALKALAGRDKSIKKIYNGDLEDLNDTSRQSCIEESNIEQVEIVINKFNNEINSEKARYELTRYLLDIFLRRVIRKENDIFEINNRYMEEDRLFKSKLDIENKIKEIKENKNDNKEKLSNLIRAEFIRENKTIIDEIKEYLKNIESDLCDLISKENDYDKFNQNCQNQYYANEIQKRIDKCKLRTDEIETYIMQNIYNTIISRFEIYTNASLQDANIKKQLIATYDDNEDFKYMNKASKVELLKNDCRTLKINNSQIDKDIEKYDRELENLKILTEKNKKKELDLSEHTQLQKNKLGKRPEKYLEYVTHTVEKKRGGFFGGIANFLFGPKKEKICEERYNDSKGIEWDRKNADIQKDYIAKQKELDKEYKKLNNSKIDYENKKEKSLLERAKNKKRIENLEKDIKVKEDELKAYERAKKEQLYTQKEQLKKGIKQYLFEGTNTQFSIEEIFINKIDSDFKENRIILEKEIMKIYDDYVSNRINNLQNIIDGNTNTLEIKYSLNKKIIEELEELHKKIVEG